MASEWVAAVAVVLVLGTIYGAYALGSGSNRSLPSGQGLHQIHEYKPTIVIELCYRNETGLETQRRVAVFRSLRHENGRLYIFGFTGRREPRMFRVDRIVQVATTDGVVLDTTRFLVDALGIPPKLIATGKA